MQFVSPSELERLNKDEIRVQLDQLNVRYSVRREPTREYLLQILKSHVSVRKS